MSILLFCAYAARSEFTELTNTPRLNWSQLVLLGFGAATLETLGSSTPRGDVRGGPTIGGPLAAGDKLWWVVRLPRLNRGLETSSLNTMTGVPGRDLMAPDGGM
jgi:hypothetical protein